MKIYIKNLKGCIYFEQNIPLTVSFNSNIHAEIFVLKRRRQMFTVQPENFEKFFKTKDQYIRSFGSKFVKGQITLNMLHPHAFRATSNLYRRNDSFLNVTGISSFKEFIIIKTTLENWLQIRSKKAIVDCLFISQKKKMSGINPAKMFELLNRHTDFFTTYEPEIFSGIVMVPYTKKKHPSLLIFSSGTVQLIAGTASFRKIIPTLLVS